MTAEYEEMTPGQILNEQLREMGCYRLVVPQAIAVMRERVVMDVTKYRSVMVTFRPGHDLYDIELVQHIKGSPRTISMDDLVYADELVPTIRARLSEHWA